jgi:hypothetical protein
MFRDVELGQGRKAHGGPEAVVGAQTIEAQLALAELALQVALHPIEIVTARRYMKAVDHHLGGLIRGQRPQQTAPELMPGLAGEDVGLQLGAQQRPGFAPEALDHMAEIDPPQRHLFTFALVEPRQGQGELAFEEQIQPVMAQMHRELVADQP